MPQPAFDPPKLNWTLLLAILLAGILIQNPFTYRPLFGNYSSYQVIMGMMSKNMVFENYRELATPKTFFMVAGKPSMHLVYFPIGSLAAALGQDLLGGLNDWWGRFQSILFSMLSILCLTIFTRRYWGERMALAASAVLTLSPMNLIYGQSFQNEACALFFSLLPLALLACSTHLPSVLLASLSFGLALLSRTHFLIVFPVFLFFFWKSENRTSALWKGALFTAIASGMLMGWLLHVYQISLNRIDVYTHPFIQLGVGKTFPHPLLSEAAFYQRILREAARLYFNPLGFLFLLPGFIFLRQARNAILAVWVACAAGLWFLLPVKIFDHHFYAYPFLPVGAILIAFGLVWCRERIGKIFWYLFFTGYAALSIFISWNPIYRYAEKGDGILAASAFVKTRTEPDDLIIDYSSAPMLVMYYSERYGWNMKNFFGNQRLHPYWQYLEKHNPGKPFYKIRNDAFRTSLTWLEYLRKEGAKLFIAADKAHLAKDGALWDHLHARYAMISDPAAEFIAFDLDTQK